MGAMAPKARTHARRLYSKTFHRDRDLPTRTVDWSRLLDEATSALDSQSERVVQKALEAGTEDGTVGGTVGVVSCFGDFPFLEIHSTRKILGDPWSTIVSGCFCLFLCCISVAICVWVGCCFVESRAS